MVTRWSFAAGSETSWSSSDLTSHTSDATTAGSETSWSSSDLTSHTSDATTCLNDSPKAQKRRMNESTHYWVPDEYSNWRRPDCIPSPHAYMTSFWLQDPMSVWSSLSLPFYRWALRTKSQAIRFTRIKKGSKNGREWRRSNLRLVVIRQFCFRKWRKW